MKAESRKKVLWLGKTPREELKHELLLRGELSLTPTAERNTNRDAPQSRAVVIEFSGNSEELQSSIRFARSSLLRHGLSVAIVQAPSTDDLKFQRVLTQLRLEPDEPIRVFYRKWAEAADWIAASDPGPGLNSRLKISGTRLPAHHRFLLRRSFWDCSSIAVRKLNPGASGATIYIVHPHRAPSGALHRILPYLVKIDIPRRVRGECDRFLSYVCDFVPFNHRPNLAFSRFAYGPDWASLVEDFIDRASPLSEVLKSANASVVIASVFEGALRGWRLCAVQKEQPLGDFFYGTKVLRESDELKEAAEFAKKHYRAKLSGSSIVKRLRAFPVVTCLYCNIHLDLHADNIFLATASADTILIDFYKTTAGPAVADPACLEVDLVFRKGRPLDLSFLRTLYKYPLGIPSLDARKPDISWLWDSVRAIRMFGVLSESDSVAYAFAVIAYLLRFASYGDNGTLRVRSLAFAIADNLVSELGHVFQKLAVSKTKTQQAI